MSNSSPLGVFIIVKVGEYVPLRQYWFRGRWEDKGFHLHGSPTGITEVSLGIRL